MHTEKPGARLSDEYRRILEIVEMFPQGVQARRIAEILRRIPSDEFGAEITQEIKALRSQLANLKKKGCITVEATAEYGNIYRPVNSPLDMSLWTLDQARLNFSNKHHERLGSDPRPVAAYSMMLGLWRNTIVEDAHAGDGLDRISDGEMFAANVATFRLIRDFLETAQCSYCGHIKWSLLRDRLIYPNRIAAGSRTVSDLLGEHYERWTEEASGAFAYYAELTESDDHDMEWFITAKGCFGSVQRNWFGLPDWPGVVDAFLAKEHGGVTSKRPRDPFPIPAEDLRAGLLDGPDRMDPEVLNWCITDGIGYMRLTDG
ncbi:hypothetical protein [Nocardia pseudovaccinii]|uniref:hypothetical protein n=1 Tax=Nocardia pseudovaccinii TaxID=189540 RepID=UPI0007A48DFF|nr:hypothetical protein [Nocardia pseudovaccinii]